MAQAARPEQVAARHLPEGAGGCGGLLLLPRHWQSIPCCGGHDWCGVSLEAQCVVDAQCDPADGHCIYEDQPDGTPCDDDDENTANNTCQGGVCDGVCPVLQRAPG